MVVKARLATMLGAAALFGAGLSAPVFAQAPSAPGAAPGRLHASAYAAVPQDLAASVRPWDNSAANLRLKTTFANSLKGRGIRLVDGGAPLSFNFETEVENLSVPEGGPTLGQVIARNHDSRVRMNFWSTTQDSLTQGRRSEAERSGTVRYILRATLDDQRSGTRLWQGEANYVGAPADETAIFAAMVPVLVDAYGQTVRLRSFQVE